MELAFFFNYSSNDNINENLMEDYLAPQNFISDFFD